MTRRLARFGGALVALTVAVWSGCAVLPSSEPPNLDLNKRQIRAYVESGDYDREIGAVAAKARAWIEERAVQGGSRLTLVLDLDETLLSNWPLLKQQDFGYVPAEWARWVGAGQAPAIEPVRAVFFAARRVGVEVVLLTGRRERDRAGTARNLQTIGCTDYADLICKPDGDSRPSGAFKTAARRDLIAGGRTVIANIGDQASDLSGGSAERTFKLPNPFYLSD